MNYKENGPRGKRFPTIWSKGVGEVIKGGGGACPVESHGTVTGTYDPGRGSTPVLVGEVSRVLIHSGSMSLIRS